MTTSQWNQVRALFDVILERTASEQTAFLDAQTDDPEVREKVRELLRLDPVTTDWFGGEVRPAALGAEGSKVEVAKLEGKRIGPYKILEPLGRGGMGSVYLAKREDVQKKVALKLVGVSFTASESARRFFLIEQRVLARLEHPNIARFLDAGITNEGVPFFAMEYVEGERITDYCETNSLPQKDRLALFMDVCEAVGYAHRSLVVHRDLKPSNIFVDREGTVKLLDFGIAKLLEEEESDGLVPGEAHRLMTPAYAAPEQLQGEAPTTATDVYQLGVVLRELLTGKRTADEAPTLDGELVAIISKATTDDPGRRYASAGTLLADLRRYRDRQPVSAHANTLPYRARKFAQRNQWGVMAATVVALSLIVGLGAALWQARVAGQERDQARLESEKSEEVTNFLMGLFEANEPGSTPTDTITARTLLQQGIEQAEALDDQPDVQAEMFSVIGRVYHRLGQFDRAESLLARALDLRNNLPGTSPLEKAALLNDLGELHWEQGALDKAEDLHREALTIRLEELPENHPDIAESMDNLGIVLAIKGQLDEAENLHREALKRLRAGPNSDSAAIGSVLNNLGLLMQDKGDYQTALTLQQEALSLWKTSLGENHNQVAIGLNNLGLLNSRLGRLATAESLYTEAIHRWRTLYGGNHPYVGMGLSNLGVVLDKQGNYAAAEEIKRQVVERHRRVFGEDHPEVAKALGNLGVTLANQGDLEAAESHYREALDLYLKVFNERHPDVARSQYSLGRLLLEKGNISEAESLLRQAIETRRQLLESNHPNLADSYRSLGELLRETRRFEEAEQFLVASYNIFNQRDMKEDVQESLEHLVELYVTWDQPESAARYRTLLETAQRNDE